MKRQALRFGILLYITIDLSLAAMPGAFVFEPADSIESTYTSRGRPVTVFVVPFAPQAESFALSRPRMDVKHRLAPRSEVEPRRHPVANRLSRSPGDARPPSEDPY